MTGLPARRLRWVGRAGEPLEQLAPGHWRCPRTDERYTQTDGLLGGPH